MSGITLSVNAAKRDIINCVARIRFNIIRAARAEEHCRLACSMLRRSAKLLEQANVFNRSRANALRAEADEIDADFKERHPVSMAQYGRVLMDVAKYFDGITTLGERCDILNVNPVDRHKLTDTDGLVQILYLHGLGDSATYRNEGERSGPMFYAMCRGFMDWQINTPEGRAVMDEMTEELFSPGGLFYGATMYRQAPDGTMVPQPHDLTVHDETGSRVIKRGPTLH